LPLAAARARIAFRRRAVLGCGRVASLSV